MENASLAQAILITLGQPVPVTQVNANEDVAASLIPAGTVFQSNETWAASPNSEYILVLQADGNLVLYVLIGASQPLAQGVQVNVRPLWAADTQGNRGDTFEVQSDGNLVVYRPDRSPLWASNTAGTWPAGLCVQDDGNLVLYKFVPAWASNTVQG